MNTLSPHQPFRPPALSPRAVSVLNALLSFTGEGGALSFAAEGDARLFTEEDNPLLWPNNHAVLRLLHMPQTVAPSIRATLRWFGGIWTVEIGQIDEIDVARLHPLLNGLPPEAEIPEALRLAALDLLVLAVLKTLRVLGGSPQSLEHGFVDSGAASEPEDAAEAAAGPFLWLESVLPDGEQCPVRVRLPEDDAPVQALLSAVKARRASEKLTSAVLSRGRVPFFDLPVAVAVEAGAMRLSVAQCSRLSIGDILLPDNYPACENRIQLVVPARRPMPVLHCSVCGLTATIEHLTLPTEASMTDSHPQELLEGPDGLSENMRSEDALSEDGLSEDGLSEETFSAVALSENTLAGSALSDDASSASVDGISVPDIDLSVSFELERRLMTVTEVAALRPGHTFTLTADPLSPVTVRVQGKAVGTGRVVDIGGTLGVQITSLS